MQALTDLKFVNLAILKMGSVMTHKELKKKKIVFLIQVSFTDS